MNRWRSLTAEQVYSDHPGIQCASAGLNRNAENPLTPELVDGLIDLCDGAKA
jgi:predicted protein tyrosine phosphatase